MRIVSHVLQFARPVIFFFFFSFSLSTSNLVAGSVWAWDWGKTNSGRGRCFNKICGDGRVKKGETELKLEKLKLDQINTK